MGAARAVEGELERLASSWDGEEVVSRYDEPSGSWIFVCIHSRRLGPAAGGTRLKVYSGPAEALEDGMRLAAGMTVKLALSGFAFGGGKAVIAVPGIPRGDDRAALFRRYGELVASLEGRFWTGADMNTAPEDFDVMAETCPYVFGRSPEHGGSGEPGPTTARGVFHGLRASVARALGSSELEGRSVLVQGVGSVGARLAMLLADAGARVLLTDVDAGRARELAARLGAVVVEPDAALEADVDVYAPCAVGATLSAETIPRLRCRIVAGAANNQLARPDDAERLHARGILYAPDFVINAGGIFHYVGIEVLGWGETELERALLGIGDTLSDVYERSDATGVSTARAAEDLARARLAAAGSGASI